MPLTAKTIEEAQQQYSELEEKVTNTDSELKNVIRESVQRKNTIRELQASIEGIKGNFKDLGLDPEGDLAEQLKEKTESAKKGTKPESEFAKMQKQLDNLMKELGSEKEARQKAISENKIEKSRNAFLAKGSKHFNDPELVVDHAINKGLVFLNDDGVVGVKQGDEFYPLEADKGTSGFDVLKKIYSKQAVTEQRGGGKDTSAGGAKGGSGKRTITQAEFEAMPHTDKRAVIESAKKGEAEIVPA